MHKTMKFGNWWGGPAEKLPGLKGDLRVETVVVGGGFTGMHTALNLHAAGREVVVLERDFIGSGASGRNSGYVDGLIGKDYPSLMKVNKIARARELCQFAKAAVHQLEAFITTHGIECDYVASGNINAAVHARQLPRLKKLEAAGEALGLHFKYLDAAAMRDRGIPPAFVAGIFDPVGGTLDPGKLVRSVRELAIARGVPIYEQTPVRRIRNGAPAVIETPNGTIHADKVVLATNAFTAQLGWKKRFYSPIWAGMFESAPLTPAQQASVGWPAMEGVYTAHEKLESYRRTSRNTLIAGGKFVHIPWGAQLKDLEHPAMAEAIEGVFRQRFPGLADLELAHFWGGWIGIPLDFMPALGTTGKHRNIYYGLGYAGHGVPQTVILGEMLAARIMGTEHPWENVLDRRTLPIPPEPFKWLASRSVDGLLGWLDRRTDRQIERP